MNAIKNVSEFLVDAANVAERINHGSHPDEAAAARALARALRDPERVARLVEGLLPTEMQAAV